MREFRSVYFGCKWIVTDNIKQHERLRKLDALFAEKVMGLHAYTSDCGEEYTYEPVGEFPTRAEYFATGKSFQPLSQFTRSLDAAWEGAEKMNLAFGIERWKDGDEWCNQAGVGYAADDAYVMEGMSHSACADHPAEALCLACLRAVGVPEEDLK